jgi:biotin carboxylase
MRRILLLGVGIPFHVHVKRLKSEGYAVIALDRDPNARQNIDAHADAFVLAGVNDLDAVLNAAQKYEVDAIVASTEAGVLVASEASSRLGLPGLPVDAAYAATDKSEMRTKWAASNLRQPFFEIARNPAQAKRTIGQLGFPCVVKPTRSWSSKGVSVVSENNEVDTALADAFAVHHGPVIIEHFVPGQLLTAEGFVSDEDTNVVLIGDVETQEYDRHRVNMALYYPANFEPRVLIEATNLIEQAALALGLKRTPFHCECMVGAEGVHLIEMGARGGGGHIFSILYEPMTGMSGIVRQVRLLLQESVDPLPLRPARGGCYKFLSAPAGIVETIEGVAEAARMPGVIDFGIAIKPGQSGGLVTNDNSRHGHVCTIGKDRAEAAMFADAAIRRVHFQ